MVCASLVSPRIAACGLSDGRIISFWNFVCNFSQRDLTWTQSWWICMGVSSSVLQNEQRRVFVIPKVYSFLLRKSSPMRILYRKERKVISIVAKRGNR